MSDSANGTAKLSNPVLQQIESQIEANLQPEVKADYDKIVVAGGHIALAHNGAMLTQLAKAPDPIVGAAKGAVGLMLIMRKDARGAMPMKAAVPAELVRGTHVFTDFLFARMGITKQGLANVAAKVHGLTQDPAAMQAIQMKAGLLKHPMAATPTPLPPGPGGLINAPPPGDGAA